MIDIDSILSTGESLTLEVKKAAGGLPKSLWDTYSAFANSYGGTIILGIDEDKDTKEFIPYGIEKPLQMMTDFWNTANNQQKVSTNILLDNHVYPIEYQGLTLLVVEVPRAERCDKPVYVGVDPFKGTFRRNNEGDYHCKREEILAMMRDQTMESVDNKVLEDMELSDLDSESIKRYRMMFKNNRRSHVWTELSDPEFLIKIGAARKGSDRQIHPTLAGLIFFGDYITITNELPNYFLDYREHLSSNNRWSDRVTSGDGTWSGNIFDFYFKIIDRLTSDVKKPFKLDKQLLRVDDTSVHAGLREGLANALIHADYYGRCGIVIDKKFRVVTISNPGTFRIGLDAAIAGGISDARNARIFNMFSLINVGERAGSGLCDIFHTWENNGYQMPVITESLDPDRITFTLELAAETTEEADGANGPENVGNTSGNVGKSGADVGNDVNNSDISVGSDVGNLNGNALYIYQRFVENPYLSAAKLAEELSLTKRSVERIIRTLKAGGFISREGSTRGKWIILK